MMNRLGILLIMLLLPTLAACQPVQAPLTGTFNVAGPPIDRAAIPSGDDCLLTVKFPYMFTGAIQGDADVHLAIIGKGDCEGMAPGRYDESIAAKGTFTGTVDGKSGSFSFIYILTAKAGEPFEGLISIIPGSGIDELQGIRSELIVRGNLSAQGEPALYEGSYYFGP